MTDANGPANDLLRVIRGTDKNLLYMELHLQYWSVPVMLQRLSAEYGTVVPTGYRV